MSCEVLIITLVAVVLNQVWPCKSTMSIDVLRHNGFSYRILILHNHAWLHHTIYHYYSCKGQAIFLYIIMTPLKFGLIGVMLHSRYHLRAMGIESVEINACWTNIRHKWLTKFIMYRKTSTKDKAEQSRAAHEIFTHWYLPK